MKAAVSSLPRGLPGYLALLRRNRNYRLLWTGQVISQSGDWFYTVALLGLITQLTGSALSGSLAIVIQTLPSAIMGLLISGFVADRFDRQKVMIAADLARAAVALCFLLVRTADWVWLAYAATAALSIGLSFFTPASSASIPNLVSADELTVAGALDVATFATTLFVGSILGGVVSQLFGRDTAFLVNSASFVLSAVFISRVRGNFSSRQGEPLPPGSLLRGLTEGLRFVRHDARIRLFVLVKPAWCLALGGIGLYSAYAFQVYGAGDMGISWLYAGRAVGAFVGPVAVNMLAPPRSAAQFVRILSVSLLVFAAGYAVLGISQTPFVGFLGTTFGHIGGSLIWFYSTLYLQRETPDSVRGRVLSLDFVLYELSVTASTLALGGLAGLFSPSVAMLCGALATLIAGIGWMTLATRKQDSVQCAP